MLKEKSNNLKLNVMLVYGSQKLLILIINEKNIPWNPRIHTMQQNYIIFSNQLIHGWHEVIQNVSTGTQYAWYGANWGGGFDN